MTWKTGFEVELLAPRGRTREDLAKRVAAQSGGDVERIFYPQSEPSKVPGTPTFENLTIGSRVRDKQGTPVASFVDDVTLQRGLDKKAAPERGWYRVVSDDSRLLQLVMQHCDPTAPLKTVLEPLAKLFGTELSHHPSGMVKVVDERNISVALAAYAPGERERPCEIITAPIAGDHLGRLSLLLGQAEAAGFHVPWEGATHIHFDGTRLKSTNAIANMARLFLRHGQYLKQLVGTNPNCVRLGGWPRAFTKLATSPDFPAMQWDEALERLRECKLSKYCDFNLVNVIGENPRKQTFEVRILPSTLSAASIIQAAMLFEAILEWCVSVPARTTRLPETPQALAQELKLPQI
ncbi:MAG: amidoligase family protein [Hyphomicrobiales bacterium]